MVFKRAIFSLQTAPWTSDGSRWFLLLLQLAAIRATPDSSSGITVAVLLLALDAHSATMRTVGLHTIDDMLSTRIYRHLFFMSCWTEERWCIRPMDFILAELCPSDKNGNEKKISRFAPDASPQANKIAIVPSSQHHRSKHHKKVKHPRRINTIVSRINISWKRL